MPRSFQGTMVDYIVPLKEGLLLPWEGFAKWFYVGMSIQPSTKGNPYNRYSPNDSVDDNLFTRKLVGRWQLVFHRYVFYNSAPFKSPPHRRTSGNPPVRDKSLLRKCLLCPHNFGFFDFQSFRWTRDFRTPCHPSKGELKKIPSLKSAAKAPEKWMVGRRSFPFGRI